jgi:hypothetical protein
MYGNKKITERSIKLENKWREFIPEDRELYTLTPERDFRTLEQRYVNRHVKLYKNLLKRYKDIKDRGKVLADYLQTYEKMDKTIPYFSHKTGDIIRYVDINTYENMLYNVNLTRSSWNSAIYDAKVLDTHLWYLPAHPYACPHCMEYQGFVYADDTPTKQEYKVLMKYGKRGEYMKEDAIKGGVGHPNCKHSWTIFWDIDQVQEDKYNSSEWEEEYEREQKKQALDLEKSRLLSDRRIYQELGDQSKVDELTTKIKAIRDKKKEL